MGQIPIFWRVIFTFFLFNIFFKWLFINSEKEIKPFIWKNGHLTPKTLLVVKLVIFVLGSNTHIFTWKVFFLIGGYELSIEEYVRPKKSGYHSWKNGDYTQKTFSEVFPIDGMVSKWKLKKWKRYSSWNFLSHTIPELHFNLENFCYLKHCNYILIKCWWWWRLPNWGGQDQEQGRSRPWAGPEQAPAGWEQARSRPGAMQ